MIACKKNNAGEVTGTIKDFTGLDGCGLMIVLDNGDRLEIVTLPAGTILKADQRVAIIYSERLVVSICMAGKTEEIKSLRYI
jgi:hypothetical protein